MSTDESTLQELRAAAKGTSPIAWFQLAQALVTAQNAEEAAQWHRRSADAGYAPAQVELARMLLHGVGVPADPARAVAWLLRAEAAGHPVAGYFLALICLGGVAMPRDARLNERVLTAANAGFAPALRAAAIHMGRKPDPTDQRQCIAMLEVAASRGDAVAALLLAERLRNGEGCEVDVERADGLLEQLAAHGIEPLPPLSVASIATTPGTTGTLELYDAMAAPPAQKLADRPVVSVIDGLLSADECRLLVASARPILRPSQTLDPHTGQPITLPLRTSNGASFDPIFEDLSLRLVQQRMASAAGVELAQAEHLVVLHYEPGQEYRPHRDYRPPESLRGDVPEAGNRARTICVYLNQPEAGGETEFPAAGLKVDPQPGRAVIFDNLLEDGSPDADSLHAGLPVIAGEKWLATLWMRQGRYRVY